MHSERLRLDWYKRRSANNGQLKMFLVDKILTYYPDIDMDMYDLYMLNYEDLCELAIACVNTGLTITGGTGQDFDDTSDAKVVISQERQNNKKRGTWTVSFRIKGVNNKIGPLRVVAWNQLEKKFYFFYIPRDSFRNRSIVEIIIQQKNGVWHDPKFSGTPDNSRHLKWWRYSKTEFEEMALSDPFTDTKLWNTIFAEVEFAS